MAVDFSLNKSYSFSTLAPSVLGDKYENLKLVGIITKDEAIKLGGDIVTTHLILCDLIPGIRNLDINSLTYYKFLTKSNDVVVIAREYINLNTVIEVSTVNIMIKIPNLNSMHLAILNNILIEKGYTTHNITTY
jgi:hypothetical protein